MARRQNPRLGSTGRLSSVGLELGLTVVVTLVAGSWLDRRFGTEPWLTLVGVFLGFGVGFLNLIRTLQRHDAAQERDR